MKRHRRTVRTVATNAATALATVAAVVSVAVMVPGTAAAAGPTWAPSAQATIHPGVNTITGAGECTANFVFYNATDEFIGQAAHCAGTGAPTETSGCTSATQPLGTPVKIVGASKPGTLVYSSWITMAKSGEKDANTCDFNDFALVKIDPADRGKVNPSVPFFGGPTAISTTAIATGQRILTYGNSPLRGGVSALSPKVGFSLGDAGGGWSHSCYTVTPGVPGDSGSAVLTNDGKALGVLTSLALAPVAGSNGVGDMSRELNYLNAHGGLGIVSLALGTDPFHSPAP
ncbi:MAG: serine protease [Actinomycetota bacterium]|nr:serine protease [Actinomycetota bacterium]